MIVVDDCHAAIVKNYLLALSLTLNLSVHLRFRVLCLAYILSYLHYWLNSLEMMS